MTEGDAGLLTGWVIGMGIWLAVFAWARRGRRF